MLKITNTIEMVTWPSGLGSSTFPILIPKLNATTAQQAVPIAVIRASVLSSGRPARTMFSVASNPAANDDPNDQINKPLIGLVQRIVPTV